MPRRCGRFISHLHWYVIVDSRPNWFNRRCISSTTHFGNFFMTSMKEPKASKLSLATIKSVPGPTSNIQQRNKWRVHCNEVPRRLFFVLWSTDSFCRTFCVMYRLARYLKWLRKPTATAANSIILNQLVYALNHAAYTSTDWELLYKSKTSIRFPLLFCSELCLEYCHTQAERPKEKQKRKLNDGHN